MKERPIICFDIGTLGVNTILAYVRADTDRPVAIKKKSYKSRCSEPRAIFEQSWVFEGNQYLLAPDFGHLLDNIFCKEHHIIWYGNMLAKHIHAATPPVDYFLIQTLGFYI